MLKISRESEINLINLLIDQDVISGKDFLTYFNVFSAIYLLNTVFLYDV